MMALVPTTGCGVGEGGNTSDVCPWWGDTEISIHERLYLKFRHRPHLPLCLYRQFCS